MTKSTSPHFTTQRTGLLLLTGLLILRLPYLTIIGTLIDPPPAWLFFSYIAATYLLTALLIYAERERLQDFWFDLSSAIVFLLQSFFFLGGMGLFAAMRRKQARFPSPPAGLLAWTLLGGLLAVLARLLIHSLQLAPLQESSGQPATLGIFFWAVLTQMTNAAVWEEPLFRGFLWGYLRRAGWHNAFAWLLQAGLFVLGHVYYLNLEAFGPWLLRMLIPALLLGLAAWGARSITAGMFAHGCFNAAGDLLGHYGTPAQAAGVAWTAAALLAGALLLALAGKNLGLRKKPAAGHTG